MSHVTRIRTLMKERRHLLAALADLGLPGDDTPETSGWVRAGQLAFHKEGEAYTLVQDRDSWSADPMPTVREITQRYAYHVAREQLEAQGFSLVNEERQADGQLHLVMRRMA